MASLPRPPLHSPRLGDAFAYLNRAPVLPERLVGDLTVGGSPVGEEKGIFPSPATRLCTVRADLSVNLMEILFINIFRDDVASM